ncbi:retrovirus-related pol polyprotein from transposon TNT 1-94 [Tanacetum coccineum]|uniref:Retrovirus-related pol polyprotein from transposon TNT 1-94 n=1 Tax=Tanacetum coccineum TaxID=301880 RepID=A0ABQ5EYG8_9ASTR
MLTNNGWVDGSGSNLGGGFGKLRGGRETLGGGDGLEGPGNNQVKDNKIDLLVQQYEQFVISEDESIDSAFARFNTIITSLKALDEGYSSKNYVRKFLRALHPKWRAKVMAIEESKDLTSLSLDELIGRFVRQPRNDKKTFQRSHDDKNGKSDRKCFRCGDPNHVIGECPKPLKDKNQRAFIGGSWSDSDEEDDENVKNKMCLVAQVSSEIITKNKRLKATRNSLEKELSILKEKVSTLEKNKGVDLECVKCHMLKIENEKLKEEALKLTKFEKSTHCLNEMLSNQKPSGDKLGLGFNSFEASSSGTKEIKFVKAQKKASSDGGPINMGGPLSVQAAPKAIMGPPPAATPGSEKSVSFQKSILGPRPKHIIVNNVKSSLVASDNEVKQFYKPLSKPGVGFSKPNFRSKTPPPRRVINNYYRPKTPQPKRNIGRQNQPCGFPFCNANGITHNFSAPRTPQSNSVVERKNKTLHEMSRTMLNEQSLPQEFWCNTVDTSTYILNRILIISILGITPYELLRGRKPTLDYFRVFESKCFILNTKDYLTKFDPKSYEGVFLGYSQNSKAYIILNKHTRKVKESLNVTFDETPPPSKTSPLVDDDLDKEEAIKVTEKKNLENDIEDETLEIDEIVNINESRNHPLKNVIGNLNQRTLRS